MTVYMLGTDVELNTAVTDDDGNPVDATVTIAVIKPDLTTLSPAPTVNHVGATGSGTYTATVTPDQAGTWFYVWTAAGAIIATDGGQFTVAVSVPPLYAPVAKLRKRLQILDNEHDDELYDALEAASREIDDDTDRVFWLEPVASPRIFNPRQRTFWSEQGQHLMIDDIGSTSGMIVEIGFGSTWTVVTDYETAPDNALAKNKAIEQLIRPYQPWTCYPTQRVRVTAQWGWPLIPAKIQNGSLIKGARIYRRKDSPEGITGFSELGVVRVNSYDPDYDSAIAGFIIHGGG
jgi:hypothetical protein